MNVRTLAIPTLILLIVGGLTLAADVPEGAAPNKSKVTSYRPNIVVYKNHHCDCCLRWVDYLVANRFAVRVENVDDLGQVKRKAGIPRDKDACHTAFIEGYFVEGHVPAEDIKRLIKTRPDAKGLVVAGMPIGSPGMERGREFQPYDVLLVDKTGDTTVYAHHGK